MAGSGRDAGQLVSDDELEAAAGYARAHAAELEEEGRRHASGDAEAERSRQPDDEHPERKVRGVAFDDERRRRRRQRDDEEDTEDAEAANEAARGAKERGLVNAEGAGRYFQDLPADRLGDLTLVDPHAMRRELGPSVRFAQHAMLLAASRMQRGDDRREALAFLADLYVRLGDRAYANKALREFGPATGVVDLYPLELMDHLLEFVPGFCNKVSRAAFLSTASSEGYRAKTGEIIPLGHDPQLRIRGFALRGGPRPGYLLEPDDTPGRYRLVFLSPGHFTAMMSAIGKDGHLYIETFECFIEQGDADVSTLTGLERARDDQSSSTGVAETPPAVPGERPKQKDDLTFHFPRRI